MVGVTIENRNKVEQLGYKITENVGDEFATKMKIIYQGRIVAKICLSRKGVLRVSVNGKIKVVKSVKIIPSLLPKTIVLEMKKKNRSTIWCQLPAKDDVVFW